MRPLLAGFVVAVILAASFMLAHVHPFGDASLFAAKSSQAPIMEPSSIPLEVRALLSDKCADCHSAQTRSPVYGHFAPISWLMERDVVEARKAMNLSQWDTYSVDQQETMKAKIMREAKTHDMPPPQFRVIHWNARITNGDVQALTRWVHDVPSATDAGSQVADGDPARGATAFQKRCTGCHAPTRNREGPRLQGVYGRTAGSVANFPYSNALRKANLVWNDQSLEKWLIDPDALLPGTNMDFHVAKPQERKDIIAFLRQSSGA